MLKGATIRVGLLQALAAVTALPDADLTEIHVTSSC
jgi:hypothetical protein